MHIIRINDIKQNLFYTVLLSDVLVHLSVSAFEVNKTDFNTHKAVQILDILLCKQE